MPSFKPANDSDMYDCTWGQTYHPNCLADYESLQKMDHYQIHRHPRPAEPQTGGPHTTSGSSSSPKAGRAGTWGGRNFGSHPHHFLFPTVSLHDLKSKIEQVSHHAQPPAVPIVPNADIRETRQAYHIEIEVPCVTDKNACIVHWLSPRILLVRGDILRPDISGNATHAPTHGIEDDAATAEKPEQMNSAPPQAADSSLLTPPVSAGLDKSISPWENLDMVWHELMQTQEQDHHDLSIN